MSKLFEKVKNGLITENPIFVQVLAMCPTLAVTTSTQNAFGMGVATTIVLVLSNMLISALRKLIPEKIRIPAYIVIIATFVSIIEMFIQGYVPTLYKSLGIFIPLIVVNCIVLGRAEAYASKNPIIPSIFDGLGMGLGFSLALILVGAIRELLGSGTILDISIMPQNYKPASVMILAPGAFITLGFLMTFLNYINIKKAEKNGTSPKVLEHGCGNCSGCGTGCNK